MTSMEGSTSVDPNAWMMVAGSVSLNTMVEMSLSAPLLMRSRRDAAMPSAMIVAKEVTLRSAVSIMPPEKGSVVSGATG